MKKIEIDENQKAGNVWANTNKKACNVLIYNTITDS
jgi:hypothetical protein